LNPKQQEIRVARRAEDWKARRLALAFDSGGKSVPLSDDTTPDEAAQIAGDFLAALQKAPEKKAAELERMVKDDSPQGKLLRESHVKERDRMTPLLRWSLLRDARFQLVIRIKPPQHEPERTSLEEMQLLWDDILPDVFPILVTEVSRKRKSTRELSREPLHVSLKLLDAAKWKELTSADKTGQSQGVKEGRERKANVFDELDRLARPKPAPPEIQTLAHILEQAKTVDPPDKQHFINAVNRALESHSFAIRIDSTGEVCRRLALDRNGYLMFQPTHGGVRGFKGNDFTLVPYVRPYRRTTPHKK